MAYASAMWQMKQKWLYEQDEIQKLLANDWEPFASMPLFDGDTGDTQILVMFRRYLTRVAS